jgi:septum formation topological specificity factor MinE
LTQNEIIDVIENHVNILQNNVHNNINENLQNNQIINEQIQEVIPEIESAANLINEIRPRNNRFIPYP